MTRPASVFLQLFGVCLMCLAGLYYGAVTHGTLTALYIGLGGIALFVLGGIGARQHLSHR